LQRALGVLAGVLLGVLAAVCVLEIGLRNLARSGLTWYDELASYILVWLTFIGAALAQQKEEHIGVEALLERAGPAAAPALRLASHAALFALQLGLLVLGARLSYRTLGERAVTLPLAMGLVYAVVPLSAGVLAFVHLVQLGRVLRKRD
jgi:TRAP-type C4-dicarboxylate transport system permease small subunit